MGGGSLDPEPLLRLLKSQRMLNKFLTAICHTENIKCSGATKITMQQRIEAKIMQYRAEGNAVKFNHLYSMLRDPETLLNNRLAHGTGQYSASPAAGSPLSTGMAQAPRWAFNANALTFKPNPFYVIQQQIGETKTCDVMAAHRNNVEIKISAQQHPILSSIDYDKSLKVMVFCAGEATNVKQDISFPHQSEIKVNGDEVKANLRGLKNKPGSTRPADITTYLRLKPATYQNRIEFTYALTTKKFYLVVYVVKTISVDELRKRIENGNKLSKATVIKEMVTKAADPDIVTTSTVLSLKCPLSTLRMDLPIRSVTCRHNQCFDATSYLQLQEQAPTWLCPLCNNSAPFESLVVDEFVRDILTSTSKSLEQVTIEPDGKWSLNPKPLTPPNRNGAYNDDFDDDDDIVEIKDHRLASVINNSTPGPTTSTPPTSLHSPAHSISSTAPRPSNKRSASAVIDLTLSDDDEEPVARAPKRQSIAGFGGSQPPFYPMPMNPNYPSS